MSAAAPNTAGTGVSVPIGRYVAGVSDRFPRVTRNRMVEVSIASREKQDILPVNILSDKSIDGSYLEFRVPGIVGRFLDLSSLALEMKVIIRNEKKERLTPAQKAVFVDSPVNSMFRSVQVYLGDRLVESNGFYNYSSYIKLLTTFQKRNLDTLGIAGMLNVDYETEPSVYDAAHFADDDDERMKRSKEAGAHVKFPLSLDIATLDQYLVDGIPLRIRLELAGNPWIIGTADDDPKYIVEMKEAKLWLDRLSPQPNALIALNDSLSAPGKTLDYVFTRTLVRTFALSPNQNMAVLDLPWGQVIPDRLYMVIQNLSNYSGTYNKNGLYFSNGRIERLQVTVNSVPIRTLYATYPTEITQVYYDTLEAVGLTSDTLLTYEAFSNGKAVYVINLEGETLENALPVEKSGNLRIHLTFGEASDENRVIFLFGDTLGVMGVDRDRTVTCDVRA